MIKRLRIFAGPNGSGKSTFIKKFPVTDKLRLGVYVNADDIEAALENKRALELQPYQIELTTNQLHKYFKLSQFAPVKLNEPDLWKNFSVSKDILKIDNNNLSVNSYIAADIAELIRQELVKKETSFSFETVMSDSRKLDFIENAKQEGYRIYLYYFSTEDPEINISRVSIRVALDGHGVSEEIIKRRYKSSLDNLKKAVQLSDRAYLFDNSGKVAKMILEVENGVDVTVIEPGEPLPNWINTYLIEKP
jgi:predicted ABC-type ATPase